MQPQVEYVPDQLYFSTHNRQLFVLKAAYDDDKEVEVFPYSLAQGASLRTAKLACQSTYSSCLGVALPGYQCSVHLCQSFFGIVELSIAFLFITLLMRPVIYLSQW